jgi:hypothetical protein
MGSMSSRVRDKWISSETGQRVGSLPSAAMVCEKKELDRDEAGGNI